MLSGATAQRSKRFFLMALAVSVSHVSQVTRGRAISVAQSSHRPWNNGIKPFQLGLFSQINARKAVDQHGFPLHRTPSAVQASHLGSTPGHWSQHSMMSTQVLAPHILSRRLKGVRAPEEDEAERKLLVQPVVTKMMEDCKYPREDIFDCTDGLLLKSLGFSKSGLYQAVETAYSGHHKLHLRPDDIMLAISQGVSMHLQYQDNAEKYRRVFVDHEGKEEIRVCADNFRTGDKLYCDSPLQASSFFEQTHFQMFLETTLYSRNCKTRSRFSAGRSSSKPCILQRSKSSVSRSRAFSPPLVCMS
jgi:hypothetical protein